MKKIIIICACLALAAGVHAQNSIETILQQVETNNKEIQAYAHTTEAQKLENRASNNLADPTLSYAHLWDSQDKNITVGELIITQSFDFPSLYVSRARMNQLKANALNAQTNAQRQSILLQAQEACLDIIYLNRQQQLLNERLKNAEELAACYRLRMETGDANTLEINKINLELLNVRTEARMNRTALDSKLKELTALNGNLSLVPGRPMPDGPAAATVQNLGLTDYPSVPLPADFGPLCEELLASDPALISIQQENQAAQKQVSVSRQVGFSFPIFQNHGKVKAARSQAISADYRKENAHLSASTALWQLYEEACNLHASMQEYAETFGRQQDLKLLRQAIEGGQISMIEYFVEVSVIYQSQANLLQLENQYQKVMARIYKSKL